MKVLLVDPLPLLLVGNENVSVILQNVITIQLKTCINMDFWHGIWVKHIRSISETSQFSFEVLEHNYKIGLILCFHILMNKIYVIRGKSAE